MFTTVCICYQFKAWIPTGILTSDSTSLCWSGFFKKPKRSHIKLTHSASDVFSLLPMRNFCYSWHHVVLWYGCFGSTITFAHISLTEQACMIFILAWLQRTLYFAHLFLPMNILYTLTSLIYFIISFDCCCHKIAKALKHQRLCTSKCKNLTTVVKLVTVFSKSNSKICWQQLCWAALHTVAVPVVRWCCGTETGDTVQQSTGTWKSVAAHYWQ